MKRNSVLLLIAAFMGVLGMGLTLSGCANNGKVFSKQYANKLLNEKLAGEKLAIKFKPLNLYDLLFTKDYIHNYKNIYNKIKFHTLYKYSIEFSNDLNKYSDSGKSAGYFTGQIDKCAVKYGTTYARKIYGCSYTFIFHPSKYYKKLINDLTDNGKLKIPTNIPPYIYNKYSTTHVGIIYARGRSRRIWHIVLFNFHPYGSLIFGEQ